MRPLQARPLHATLALALALTLGAGCSRVGERVGPARGGAIPGTLRYADVQEVSGLNPLLRLEAVGTDLDMFIFGFFFNLDDKMRLVPELATEVPTYQNGGISKDGLTLTYHLRKGVRWHDRQPFTARDVVFTTHAILNRRNNLQQTTGWDEIAGVEALDGYTVRFHLKKIFAPAITTFFAESGLYPVLPAHVLEKYPDINRVPFNSHPIGTGPFKFVKWVHGDRIELEANPDYWRGPPKLKHVIYKFVPKDTTVLLQLRTHEIDAWFRAPSNLFIELKKLSDYRVQREPSLIYAHLDLNLKNPLFGDIRVRRAINYAIDKKKIIASVTHSVNIPAYADVAPLSWAYEPNVRHYDYDPETARRLLDEAGWVVGPDGVRINGKQRLAFTLSAVAGGATGEAAEALVQEQLKQVGVAATIKNYPASLFFGPYQDGGILQTGKYDVGFFSWVAGADPDNSSLYMCDQAPPKGQNNLFWCDLTLDGAERGALSTYERATRKKYYSIIEKELADQSVTIFLYYVRQIFVTSPELRGFVPAPATTSNWNTWEWSVQ